MDNAQDNIVWGIRSRSLPLEGILIDDTIPCTQDTYLAGYITGYAHAADMAIQLVERYLGEVHKDAS